MVRDAADIVRIELPTPWDIGPVNVFLVIGDPLTLVDCGPRWEPALAALEAGLGAAGHRIEDLERVVITHQHADHAGAAAEIARRSGAAVGSLDRLAAWLGDMPAAQERDDRLALAVAGCHGLDDAVLDAIVAELAGDNDFREAVAVDMPLAEGDDVLLGGRRWRVRHLPGHSPSDTVLHDVAGARAIAGDVLLGHMGAKPVLAVPLDGTWPTVRPPGLVDQVTSLRALDALGLREVLAGHGAPIVAPGPLIARRLSDLDRRTDSVLDAILDRGRSTAAGIERALWPRTPPGLRHFTLFETLGHLDLLRRRGRVRELREADGPILFEVSAGRRARASVRRSRA